MALHKFYADDHFHVTSVACLWHYWVQLESWGVILIVRLVTHVRFMFFTVIVLGSAITGGAEVSSWSDLCIPVIPPTFAISSESWLSSNVNICDVDYFERVLLLVLLKSAMFPSYVRLNSVQSYKTCMTVKYVILHKTLILHNFFSFSN